MSDPIEGAKDAPAAMLLGMVKLGSVVIHVDDAYRAAAFWSQALGYEPLQGSPDCARIAPKDGNAPHFAFDEEDRTHLDLFVANKEEQQQEIERLTSLGAKRVPNWPYRPGQDHVVMADTEGNLFCVCISH